MGVGKDEDEHQLSLEPVVQFSQPIVPCRRRRSPIIQQGWTSCWAAPVRDGILLATARKSIPHASQASLPYISRRPIIRHIAHAVSMSVQLRAAARNWVGDSSALPASASASLQSPSLPGLRLRRLRRLHLRRAKLQRPILL